MSKLEKARERLRSKPKDYTYSELRSLLLQLGYVEITKGKTSGSRVAFFRAADEDMIRLHKPHPGDIINPATIKDIVSHLTEIGEL